MMLDIKNIWADIWFKAKIKYQLFFYVRDRLVQARACFFVGRSQALERRRTIKNRAFRHSGSEKKFLKKLFKNLLTLPRWSGIL